MKKAKIKDDNGKLIEVDIIKFKKHLEQLYGKISRGAGDVFEDLTTLDDDFRGAIQESIEATNSVVPLERYFQICKPNLGKFMVILVNELPSTERGEGGFGSTGK